MPFYDLTCPNDHEQFDRLLKIGERPPCPTCGEPTTTLWTGKGTAVIPDDVPGGILVKNGLCHENGEPRRFDSKSEMQRFAKERGWTQYVTHVGGRSGDKNRHTSRWI